MVVVAGLTCAQLAGVTGAEPGGNAQLVTLNAKPEPIPIDPSKTAVIVVDMENDFAAKGGCLIELGSTFSARRK
jgi:ureidoacrylate peracid hydrolase